MTCRSSGQTLGVVPENLQFILWVAARQGGFVTETKMNRYWTVLISITTGAAGLLIVTFWFQPILRCRSIYELVAFTPLPCLQTLRSINRAVYRNNYSTRRAMESETPHCRTPRALHVIRFTTSSTTMDYEDRGSVA